MKRPRRIIHEIGLNIEVIVFIYEHIKNIHSVNKLFIYKEDNGGSSGSSSQCPSSFFWMFDFQLHESVASQTDLRDQLWQNQIFTQYRSGSCITTAFSSPT